MTTITEAQQLTTLWQQLARDNLAFFMEYESNGQWLPAPHLTLLCEKLQAVERGEIKRLMVFMPPRHGKSEVISKKFPAWYLGRHPNDEIILSSYGADLANDHSRIARDTLKEWGPKLWGITVAKESAAVDRWTVSKHRGGLNAAGVGGALTGKGAKIAIIDDPFKGMEEADSETNRRKVATWYRTTLRMRLAPGGAIVIVMTRWHEDDLAGMLLQKQLIDTKEDLIPWEVISIPIEAEEDDILGRDVGEWLWPERFSPAEYADLKATATPREYSALGMQNPVPDTGGILQRHWWRYWHYPGQMLPPVPVKMPDGEISLITPTQLPDKFDLYVQSWDCAFKDLKDSDFVSGQAWAKKGANSFLLDRDKGKYDFPKTLAAIRKMTFKHPLARHKYIEDKANGSAVISTLRHEIPGLIPVNPDGGKVSRANAISFAIQAGNVFLPHPSIAPWVEDFINECTAFPNGKKDDDVDACTQALNKFYKRRHLGLVAKPAGW